jgi:glycosyltransferase involved in cell wall biosynthesis
MKRITIVAPVNTYTGFGQITIEMFRLLERMGYFVTIRKTGFSEAFGARVPAEIKARFVNGPQAEEWEIAMQSLNYRCTPGKKTVLMTMWETTTIPHGARELMNEAEVVVVPCQWNASCFAACGVTRPIRVVPLGIDPKLYYMRLNTNATKGTFKFGCAGRWFHGAERKGINETVELFQRAFPTNEDVSMECKVFSDCPTPEMNDPRITFQKTFWTDEQMSNWYQSLDCFVSLALGEGWGLHQHQAMAVGRPIISPKFGGVAEFFDDRAGYPVKFNLEPVPQPNTFRYIGCWAKMDADDVIAQMRLAFQNRDLSEAKGQEAAKIAARFTWDRFGEELRAVMAEFGAL